MTGSSQARTQAPLGTQSADRGCADPRHRTDEPAYQGALGCWCLTDGWDLRLQGVDRSDRRRGTYRKQAGLKEPRGTSERQRGCTCPSYGAGELMHD